MKFKLFKCNHCGNLWVGFEGFACAVCYKGLMVYEAKELGKSTVTEIEGPLSDSCDANNPYEQQYHTKEPIFIGESVYNGPSILDLSTKR